MSVRAQLLGEIRTTLLGMRSLNLSSESSAADIYEAYVFSLAIDAADREGAVISFEDILGISTTQLVFRTSPGHIFSSQTRTQQIPYTHAVLAIPGKPELELHQGIYVSGKSGLLHECDVAIVFRSEGQTCRSARVNPRCARVLLAAECKFYSSGLGIGLARAFIGLTSDLSTDGRFFVSNTSSDSVRKLLTHHKRQWQQDVAPPNGIVVNRLRALFENVIQEYKARY